MRKRDCELLRLTPEEWRARCFESTHSEYLYFKEQRLKQLKQELAEAMFASSDYYERNGIQQEIVYIEKAIKVTEDDRALLHMKGKHV